MSAAKVDVLAVLDEFALRVHPYESLAVAEQHYRDARAALAELIAGAQKFRREFDAEVANNEGENPLTDPGCVVCTDGTTPHDRDTGLCGYHALSAALARVSP